MAKKATGGGVWNGDWRFAMLKSVGVGALLFSAVVSAIVGAGIVFLATVLAAWILFPVLVGPRNVLDAGCLFTMISLGIVVVVSLAQYGAGSLLP
ncbi:MAG TPA: hypothetical protein VFJ72_06185 [Rubrobacteraceae bacterium]|nr:hypothetical protein [Rubrobacteraceae bacterium]